MGNKNKPYRCVVCDHVNDGKGWKSLDFFEALSLQRVFPVGDCEFKSIYHEGVYSPKCVANYLKELREEGGISRAEYLQLANDMHFAMKIALANGLYMEPCPGEKLEESLKKPKQSLSDFLMENSNLPGDSIEMKGGIIK